MRPQKAFAAEPRQPRSLQRLCWACFEAEPKPEQGCRRAWSRQPCPLHLLDSTAFGKGLSWSCSALQSPWAKLPPAPLLLSQLKQWWM